MLTRVFIRRFGSPWTHQGTQYFCTDTTNESNSGQHVDQSQKTIIIFPGQGSQYVGMVHDEVLQQCPNAKQLFEQANSILGYNLLDLCQRGPEKELNKTVHSQPAVFVSSLAAVERLATMNQNTVNNCIATAGFSVGEIAALVLAGSMSFVDGLRFIKLRAEVMQEASDRYPGGMMTVFYEPNAKVKMACLGARKYCIGLGINEDESVCCVANYLFPHCKVISGHISALDFVEKNAKDFGIKRTKRLPVSGAFHSDLMYPCRPVLKNALEKIEIRPPRIDVYSNIDAETYTSPDHIRRALMAQVSTSVMWEQILHKLYERPKDAAHPITFSCGPGNQMVSILGMVNLRAKKSAYSVES